MDYEYFTTFWLDFDIAERFGCTAINDTAKRAYQEWKNDVKYLTELIMVINHKCWDHYRAGNRKLSEYYSDLYYEYYDKALHYLDNNGKKEDLVYFIQTLD